MVRVVVSAVTLLLCSSNVSAYSTPVSSETDAKISSSRRDFLGAAFTTAAATLPFVLGEQRALADDSSPQEDVYFGVGCFWHIQHELVAAERSILGRSDVQLTSRTGYAGGTRTDKEGRVCYHNIQFIADYGKLGHGEVVGMTIPTASIPDFATAYFDLFRNGERVDPQDIGSEYRSLLGLPGGVDHPSYKNMKEIAAKYGLTLVEGKGNDPDTLFQKKIYVMDTAKFPFHRAEVYHQFHNDFQSPPYGKAYNSLVDTDFESGKIDSTGCPDRV